MLLQKCQLALRSVMAVRPVLLFLYLLFSFKSFFDFSELISKCFWFLSMCSVHVYAVFLQNIRTRLTNRNSYFWVNVHDLVLAGLGYSYLLIIWLKFSWSFLCILYPFLFKYCNLYLYFLPLVTWWYISGQHLAFYTLIYTLTHSIYRCIYLYSSMFFFFVTVYHYTCDCAFSLSYVK